MWFSILSFLKVYPLGSYSQMTGFYRPLGIVIFCIVIATTQNIAYFVSFSSMFGNFILHYTLFYNYPNRCCGCQSNKTRQVKMGLASIFIPQPYLLLFIRTNYNFMVGFFFSLKNIETMWIHLFAFSQVNSGRLYILGSNLLSYFTCYCSIHTTGMYIVPIPFVQLHSTLYWIEQVLY